MSRDQESGQEVRRDAATVRDEILELRRRVEELEHAIADLQVELRQFYEQESYPPA